ncbi:MAG TPA: cyclic nucleotide-binding domain-containing protein [Candidatus Limnocylindria bacterium]|jgi:putative peptide zinc metalloprotease protein|nr:cyclic nucleotide-binding domain-containing protein [Candidatus Limnocylindria bacterium]
MEGIWSVLRERLDYASFVPRLVPDIERAELRRRDGSTYFVLKNPRGENGAGLYVRLEPEDLRLVDLMDGERTTQDILVAHLERHGTFALDRLARVTAYLGANGFFGEERAPVYEKLAARRAQRDPLTRLSLILRRLIMWDIARWNNAEGVVDFVYRFGGRLAFTRVGGTLLVLLALAGIVVWIRELGTGRHGLATVQGSYVLGILALTLLQVVSISVHEAGHALAIRHYGRRVRRLGVMIYYLFPCAYVDATDMAMASRPQRIVVALAGPIGGATVGAICAFVAAFEGGIVGSIAFQGASLFTFQLVLNLVPILELDGYHVLVDLLDAPFLRQRSMAFARTAIIRKLQRRERWSRGEVGLAVFGAIAIATSLLVLVFSLTLWQSRLATAAKELFAKGPAGVLGVTLLVLVFVGPILLALAGRLVGAIRTFARLRSARARRARLGTVQERAAVLSRVRFFAGLPRPALLAIASHLREQPVEADATVVTADEVGDQFYLVRSGRLQAVSRDGQVLGTILAGEGFGEMALLDRKPRGATVQALEPCVLWSLDRGHFERWVRDRYEIAARIRSSAEERAVLAALPFFRGLDALELDRIAARLVTRRVPAGQIVFSEGDPGDRYYVIREGEAEVRIAGAFVRKLARGDSFGELSLLLGEPRSATVTALTDLALAGLGREDFLRLVRSSGEKVSEFRARTAHYVGAGLGSESRGA